jgi:integrase
MTQNSRLQYGTVSKRGKKNKVWIGRWREEVPGLDGSIRMVRRSVILGAVEEILSKRDAERELWEHLKLLNVGKEGSSGPMTLRRFADEIWKPSVFPSVKLSTRLFYDHNLKTHILPVFGDIPLRALTRDGVQKWLHGKFSAGLTWNSVRHLRTTFGTLLNAAEMDELIRQNVVKKTRLPRRIYSEEPPMVSLDDLKSLLKELPEPSRSIAALIVLTGLRIGEMLALRWCDVDLIAETLRVRQTVYEGHFDTPKTKRSRRVVPLSPIAVQILSLQKQGNGTVLIFSSATGTPLCRRNLLNRQFRPTAVRLGLKGFNWHWLRHATASLLDAAGAPLGTVQTLLGHTSSEVTREHYIHAVSSESRNAVGRIEELAIGLEWTQIEPEAEKARALAS